MALSEPFDILTGFPGWVTEFEPVSRDEQSRQANGATRTKNLGSPLWRLSAMSKQLSANRLDYWRARLEAMANGKRTFLGYSLSRTYPIRYPKGSWPTGASFSGTTAAVNNPGTNNRSLRVKGLPAGYRIAIGDMIQINRAGRLDLHRALEDALAASTGITPHFEVYPPLWPSVAADDPVSVLRPACLMTIVPGSVTSAADAQTGRGSIAFQAMEYR